MSHVELVPLDAVTHEVRIVEIVGKTRYEPNRQYPWLGQHGCVCQYFTTQSEAVEFARTGGKQ